MHFHTRAYNSFAMSTLTYVAQLETPPKSVLQSELAGLHLTIKGPGGIGPRGWANPQDLWRLREDFGQETSCLSLAWLAEAAHTRVFLADPACTSRSFKNDLALLEEAMRKPLNLKNWATWQDWYRRAFACTISTDYNNTRNKIGNIKQHSDYITHIIDHARQQHKNRHAKPHPPIQKLVYKLISNQYSQNKVERIRNKLKRWQLHNHALTHCPPNTPLIRLTPNWQAHRTSLMLDSLRPITSPRVRAAVFSTLWNRWNTHRRWQRRNHRENVCLMRCSPNAEDSIEHYCTCHTVKQAMRRNLNLDPFYYANLHSFMFCNTHVNSIETLATIALVIYGTYTTTNMLRNHQEHLSHNTSPNFAYDMLIQNIKNGALHHHASTRILNARWIKNAATTPFNLRNTR